ncbi:hypothetical protein D9758_000232 [Tetrapyrgos nigripes]|uniref:N-acetyltransferase domain-containing protein n=1 Tax=Tetrapyrgos nigripes TaxID=182062 RepID=A0A8H5LZ80_9AGAR|nr:hypothetical protein D9758_000232 [Tetrapyrgos nigripes]
MASVAQIRPYEPRDAKDVIFAVGKANMQLLAVANMKAISHPLTLVLWIAMSSIFVEYMHWWPQGGYGFLGYLSPLPAFASLAVPILAICDWINRPYFEDLSQEVLRKPDLQNIPENYKKSPSSGFWLLDFGDKFVGLIAVDASPEEASPAPRKKSKTSQTSDTAIIRHFYVEEPYRAADIQKDLLQYAVRHVFDSSPTVQNIEVITSSLTRYAQKSLHELGFRVKEETKRVGIFGWKLERRVLERVNWRP